MKPTYTQKDAARSFIQWNTHAERFLGTLSEAGNIRRMDGTRVLNVKPEPAQQYYLDQFIDTGKSIFPLLIAREYATTETP